MGLFKLHDNFFKSLLDDRFLILYDQVIFSVFNFASIFLLSKILAFEIFSSLVLFQSYIFFIFIFTTFLLSAPSLVLLNKYWKQKKEAYLSVLLWTNLFVSSVLAIICFFFLKVQEVEVSFVFVFGVPFMMSTFDIIKKYIILNYSIKLYHSIFASGILNLVFFIPILLCKAPLTLFDILKLYFIAYVVAVFYLVVVLLYYKVISAEIVKYVKYRGFIKTVLQGHYNYSKWIILGGVAFWGYSHGLYIFSEEMLVSDFGISKVKTTQNILGVVNILIISVENYYTPLFSRSISQKPNILVSNLVIDLYKKYTLYVIAVLFAVFIVALLGYNYLYEAKYGKGFTLILLFTFTQLILFLIRPLVIALKSLEITYPFFYAHLFALITMVTGGYLLIKTFAHTGMAFTYLLCMFVFCLTVYYHYQKKVKSQS